jgi:predicted O-methyltransferase YrrM
MPLAGIPSSREGLGLKRTELLKTAFRIGALQKEDELSQLLDLVEETKPKTVVEIGTKLGGTLFCFCKLSDPEAMIVSIDLPGGGFGGGYDAQRADFMTKSFPLEGQRFHTIMADSHDPGTRAKLEQVLDGRDIDFLFIDGDHTYQGVKLDFEMYAPLVRSGGLVGFHDILPHAGVPISRVHELWDEIKHDYEYEEYAVQPYFWGGIGVLWQK